MLGTEVTIKIFSSHNSDNNSIALNAAFDEIKRVEDECSFFNKESELFLLNSKAFLEPVKVSDELFFLIEKGLWMSGKTRGAFDVTATSLAMQDGYKKIILDKEKKEVYFAEENCEIDLGAYAKGYAVDKAIEALEKHLVENAVVEAGGDLRVIGLPFPKKEWKIGIRNPIDASKILDVIKTDKEIAIATSGNYLRKHIIPLEEREEDIVSMTVMSKTTMEADLFATALFNMKEEERLKLLREFDNIKVVIVKEDKNGALRVIK
ncbi:MAG: FAD:protein FMN transferase [Candidatus Omnitrophota bacterium]